MDSSPISKEPPPSGYLSAKAKSQYTLVAGILVGLFVVGELVLPQIVSLMFMPKLMAGGFEVDQFDASRSTFWAGEVWCSVESIQGRRRKRTRLERLSPAGNLVPGNGVDVAMSKPWLLAGDDRLWLISPGAVGFYDGKNVTVVKPRKTLGSTSRPFWYEGAPAVVEKDPNGYRLWVFADGEWTEKAALQLRRDFQKFPGPANPVAQMMAANSTDLELQVVPIAGEFQVFLREGNTLYTRNGLGEIALDAERDEAARDAPQQVPEGGDDPQPQAPEPNPVPAHLARAEWQVVAQVDGAWTATELDGEAVVFHANHGFKPSGINGRKLQDGRWTPFFRDAGTKASKLAALSLGKPGQFILLSSNTNLQTMQVKKVRDGKVVQKQRLGAAFPFGMIITKFLPMYAVMICIPLIMSLTLVLVLSSLMRSYRQSEFTSETEDEIFTETGSEFVTQLESAPFASLTQRTLARLIDSVIYSLPLIPAAILFYLYFDREAFMEFFDAPGPRPFQALGKELIWIMAGFALMTFWWFFLFVAFSFTEGKWGLTPGKWILGIRVVGLNLEPRGVLWALLRNLLMIFDSFFNYLLGIGLIAFTENRQRIGDLAAGTIVIAPDSQKPEAETFTL